MKSLGNLLISSFFQYLGTSDNSLTRSRPRKGSIRLGSVELNPFLRTPSTTRARSGSFRASLFGSRKSVIPEGFEGVPASPTKPSTSTSRVRGKSETKDEDRMIGEQ